MATTDIFSRFIPAIRTDIAQTGVVTMCSNVVPVPGDLDTLFGTGPASFKVMEHLFSHQLEMNFCGVRQTALANFMMANKVDVSKKISMDNMGHGLMNLRPYILAKTVAPINNNYWTFTGGKKCTVAGANAGDDTDTHWELDVASPTGIPLENSGSHDWFNAGERVTTYSIATDGSAVVGHWVVVLSVAGNLVLENANAGSFLPAARKVSEAAGVWTNGPANGVLVRGTANVSDYEKWCAQIPGLITNNLKPFWFETVRDSFAVDEQYEMWRDLIFNNNPLYAAYYDLPAAQYNKQAGEDFHRRFLNTVWNGAPISANQTMALVNSLPQITDFELLGQKCIGRKANAIGFYEQHVEAERVHDAQGNALNLQSLFNSIYQIIKIRQNSGHPNPKVIEIWMPSNYRPIFAQAMLRYFKERGEGMLQLNLNLSAKGQQSPLGFWYYEYAMDFPECTIRIITDPFFDDLLDTFIGHGLATGSENFANLGRQLWIWDWSKNYIGILDSNRVVHKTGDLKALAAVNADYRCVMKVPTTTTTMMSTTWTAISECPAGDLIIENFSNAIPEHAAVGPDYDDN